MDGVDLRGGGEHLGVQASKPEGDYSAARITAKQKDSSIRIPLPSLGLRVSERKLLLLVMDLLLINLALAISLVERGLLREDWHFWIKVHWFAVLSGLWVVVAVFFELYNLKKAASHVASVWAASAAIVVTAFLYGAIPFVTPMLPERRIMALLFPVIAIIVIGFWRIIYATFFVQPIFQRRALIIGAGTTGRTLAHLIEKLSGGNGFSNPATGYKLLGFIDHREKLRGLKIEGVPVLGIGKEVLHSVKQLLPNEIILGYRRSDSIPRDLFEAIIHCGEMGIPVVSAATVYEELTGRVPLSHVGRNLSLVFPLKEPIELRFYNVFRRIFDILVSLVGCVLLVVVIPFVWLANRFSPGPLFYRQRRVGKSGRIFHIIKFRSMINDAEKETGAIWASRSDSRVTVVGRFLRKSRLDELPQLWNVLKGHMSLIGPRPERPEFVEQLSKEFPYYRIRHAVKPGITGWAQVRYSYGASVGDAEKKLQYDLYYIKHQGPYLDSLILLHTMKVILRFNGV